MTSAQKAEATFGTWIEPPPESGPDFHPSAVIHANRDPREHYRYRNRSGRRSFGAFAHPLLDEMTYRRETGTRSIQKQGPKTLLEHPRTRAEVRSIRSPKEIRLP